MPFKRAPQLDQKKYSDVVPISDQITQYAKGLDESEQDRKHREALERAKDVKDDVSESLGSKDLPAKYKIQVYFGKNRTTQGPNPVEITFWESGKQLHGGGDESMPICRDSTSKANPPPGCGRPFSTDHIFSSEAGMVAVCPHCKSAVNAEKLARNFHARVETRTLSKFLARLWRQLDGNSDIYLKFQPGDIRYAAIHGTEGFRKGQIPAIYSLKRMIEDTSHGTALEDRIYAFLIA